MQLNSYKKQGKTVDSSECLWSFPYGLIASASEKLATELEKVTFKDFSLPFGWEYRSEDHEIRRNQNIIGSPGDGARSFL